MVQKVPTHNVGCPHMDRPREWSPKEILMKICAMLFLSIAVIMSAGQLIAAEQDQPQSTVLLMKCTSCEHDGWYEIPKGATSHICPLCKGEMILAKEFKEPERWSARDYKSIPVWHCGYGDSGSPGKGKKKPSWQRSPPIYYHMNGYTAPGYCWQSAPGQYLKGTS